MSNPPDRTPVSGPEAPSGENRRGFIAAAVALGSAAVALLVPAVTAVVAFFHPLRQKGGGEKLVKVADLTALPEDGTPQMFPVVTDETDAWTRATDQTVGSVYLRRTGDEKKPVVAFQVVCPHAGCTIRYEKTDAGGQFLCPCHEARFDLAGKQLEESSRSPRPMDELEVEINDNAVSVKFVNFRTGIPEKVPEA
jgi:Rieske Fe-S protein